MCKVKDFLSKLEEIAPLVYSDMQVKQGAYDNSGIIANNGSDVKSVLFSLDLSKSAIDKAIEIGADLIVTHHPAIYTPIASLTFDGENKNLIRAIGNNINVISMHLNLDVAPQGIDLQLAKALGGTDLSCLQGLGVSDDVGYGKAFNVKEQTLKEYVAYIKDKLNTQKVIAYGDNKVISVASFCGGGASIAVQMLKDGILKNVDTIISSDLSHHHIYAILESGKNAIIIPHYVAENYGFNKFFELVKEKNNQFKMAYFEDKAFM